MVSILGDYNYTFPKPIPLKLKLKDMLEDNVDEKYYLSDKMLDYMMSESSGGLSRKEMFERNFKEDKDVAATITTCAGNRASDNFIKIIPFGTYYTWKDKQGNINTQCNRAADENRNALTVACANTGNVLTNYRIRKLTPRECFRLMGVKDEDYDKIAKNQSDSSLYHLAGDSIVVDILCYLYKQLL
jgi:DNA (cytosine-5)-methyltransferase 1